MVNVGVRQGSEASIWIVVCRRRVRKEYHAVVAKHCIARCRMTAILCSCSRDDDRIDAPLTQDNIEVCTEETAVAMLLDHVLTGCRSEPRRAVHQCIAIGDWRMPAGRRKPQCRTRTPLPSRIWVGLHMGCKDHSDRSVATNLEGFGKRKTPFRKSAARSQVI
jgi:hypothetical protein